MEPPSNQHATSCWKGSFARPTGLTTKTSPSPTYRPSVRFTLAVRSLKRTAFLIGHQKKMDNAQKRGKGQQDVLLGALYRGAEAHISYKAGGNETAQISVADKGKATMSEKYTVAHSQHVGLKFFALKWQNLQMDDMTTGHPVMTLHTEALTFALRTNSPALKIHRNELLICRSEFCSLYHDYSCQTGNRLIHF